MIGIRTPKGDVWIQEDEWPQWVRSGRITAESWVHAGGASAGRWRRASDLEIFWREMNSREDPSSTPLYPADILGENDGQRSGAGPEILPLPQPPLPEFLRYIFPKSGFSATEILVFLNVLIAALLVFSWKGEYSSELRDMSARWRIGVAEGKYYYLIFTTFLHGGARHLVYNMASLLAASAAVEYTFGRRGTVLAYFVTGLGGAVLSLVQKQSSLLSVGASGAIFGFGGIMIIFLIRFYRCLSARQKWKTRRIYIPLMMLLFLPSLFHGDAWGHLGGLGAGLILGWFLPPVGYIRRLLEWIHGERLQNRNP